MILLLKAALTIAAIFLNRNDRRMLLLSAVIGTNVLLPIHLFTTYESFSWVCFAAELITAAFVLYLRTKATYVIMNFCVMLSVHHLINAGFNNFCLNDTYRFVVKMCEFGAIVTCCVCSKTVQDFAKVNRYQIYRVYY